MCGICGALHLDGRPVEAEVISAMNQTLRHRGPDGDGFFCDGPVALAMRRLSIIDIAGSDQPLYNEDRSVTVVFNGEIFNYLDLRAQLIQKGHRFHTNGDGETIAHLYEEYGLDAPKHLRGQFAFLLWDSHGQRFLMARDRMGQKPLYYYYDGRVFVCGSEIKALLSHPDVPRESALDDAEMLALYLGYGYIPAPRTAFKGIHALLPGHLLTLHDKILSTRPYWSLPEVVDAVESPRPIAEYASEMLSLLEEAVRLRLIADVPLGAFLSGGLDSSLIVALMRKHSSGPVKTFSIGFEGDDSFDETPYAQQVAHTLETEHTAFTVKPEALSLLPKLVWQYDQPFADSSAIPTYIVSELTRKQVTVALNGDGGDELFAGYERFYAASLVQKWGGLPQFAWKLMAKLLAALPEGTGYYDRIKRAGRFARAASLPLPLAYFDWVRLFDGHTIQHLTGQPDHAGEDFLRLFIGKKGLPGILHANMTTYLPDDLLVKADRCSMAASLEARSPFMDHPLVEYAAKIPFDLKLKERVGKYILKEAARALLPEAIIHRKKHGFGVPLGSWLRRDMTLVRDSLLDGHLSRQVNRAAVRQLIDEHTAGQRDHGQRLWTLLTLEEWQRRFIDAPTLSP